MVAAHYRSARFARFLRPQKFQSRNGRIEESFDPHCPAVQEQTYFENVKPIGNSVPVKQIIEEESAS
jgi:hypothetical protein